MEEQQNMLEVTVDKSHIVTIGERLYGESIELIRELINNAYDAAALTTWGPTAQNALQKAQLFI